MGALAIPIVIGIVALVAAGLAATRFAHVRRVQTDKMRRRPQTLHYQVPNGFDPADVVLRLSREGYEVVPDATVGQSGELLIGGRGDKAPDRETIRRVLTELGEEIDPAGGSDLVRFIDE